MAVEHSVSKRVIYFDILRVVAIFAVVAVHISAQHWLDVDVSSRAWFAFNLLYFRTWISPHKTPSKPVSTPLEGAMI